MSPGVKTILITVLVFAIAAAAISFYRYMIVGDVQFDTEGFTLEEE